MTRNGSDTNVCASTTAVVVNAIWIPGGVEVLARSARAGRTRTAGRCHRRPAAAPAAAGSAAASAATSRASLRASTNAIGTPSSTHSAVLAAAVLQAQHQCGHRGSAGDQRPEVRPVDLGGHRDQRQHDEQRPDGGGDVDPAGQAGRDASRLGETGLAEDLLARLAGDQVDELLGEVGLRRVSSAPRSDRCSPRRRLRRISPSSPCRRRRGHR